LRSFQAPPLLERVIQYLMTVKAEPEACSVDGAVRMKYWEKYCEYFHLLDADMQHTSALSAQRYSLSRAESAVASGGIQLRAREDDGCFQHILSTIKKDKPLVRLVTDEEEDDPLALGDVPEGTEVRVLAQSDLELVQKQLRAAAFSSNQRAVAATAAEHAEMAAEVAAEMDDIDMPDTLRKGQPSAVSGSDASTCSAAIETLLWFGLALGEAPKRHDGPRRPRRRTRTAEQMLLEMELDSSSAVLADDVSTADSCEFAFDWGLAMREVGLSDAQQAEEALLAVRALEVAEADATLGDAFDGAQLSADCLNSDEGSESGYDMASSDQSSAACSNASDSDSSDSPQDFCANGRRKRRKHDYKKLCQAGH